MSGALPLLLIYALMAWTGITLTLSSTTERYIIGKAAECTLGVMHSLHILPANLSRCWIHTGE